MNALLNFAFVVSLPVLNSCSTVGVYLGPLPGEKAPGMMPDGTDFLCCLQGSLQIRGQVYCE